MRNILVLSALLSTYVLLSGCELIVEKADISQDCGNGALDADEVCDDLELNGETCTTMGYYAGELRCSAGCQGFDRSGCMGRCGDNQVDLAYGEVCDDTDLNGETCASQGSGSGDLACASNCQTFNLSGCEGACGDGVAQTSRGELCDGEDFAGETCENNGFYYGILICEDDCNSFDTTQCFGFCGDGVVQEDQAEDCDTLSLNNQTCISLGYYGGTLECNSDCTFDASMCAGRCGDDVLQVADGEVCDTNQLSGQTCQSRGFYTGTLACSSNCGYLDESGCSGMCGDNSMDDSFGEACDGTDLDGQTCTALGYYGGAITCQSDCSSLNTTGCVSAGRCGDSTVQGAYGEVCDGANQNGATCITRGFYGGTLSCNASCQGFNETQCVGRCGDGTLQLANGESCDGAALNGATCISRGYYGGTLSCNTNCSFNETQCMGSCNDGVLQTADGEVCDGVNLNGQTCIGLGFYGGSLACGANCTALNTLGCEAAGRCGDSTVQASYGETCDNSNLNSQTCVTRGFYAGTLSCNANCQAFDESQCIGRCGDGTIQAAFSEVCDGANLNSQTCVTRGYYGGNLACNANCIGFNETDCIAIGKCGDSTIQFGYGEVCDGSNLNAQTCVSQGYYPGTLSCTNCAFNLSLCGGRCGDGFIQGSQGEQCEGSNLNGASCATRGFYTGTLGCGSDCRYNTSGCQFFCGDGTVQTGDGEQCDGSNLDGQTCQLQGYYPGTLGCSSTCDFAFDMCSGRCGDGVIQGVYGEECDGSNINSQTCNSQSFTFGSISCGGSCQFNYSQCKQVISLAAGSDQTCIVLSDGSNRCWGYNEYGQLGDGTLINRNLPVPVTGIVNAISISNYSQHACSVLSDGTVSCWGRNLFGALGDGTTIDRSTPVSVTGLSNVWKISVGSAFSCILLNSGSLKCWGYNNNGQLGYGPNPSSNVPVDVVDVVGGIAITAGSSHACAVLNTGGIKCWGRNNFGQLGDGTTIDRNIPVFVAGISNAIDAVAGAQHTCALLAGGQIYCWGRNNYGQLGIGNNLDQHIPVAVNGVLNAIRVTGGVFHTCSILSNSTAKCWGQNNYGQLGDGLTTDRNLPTDVLSLLNIDLLDAGLYHTCALQTSGDLKCWGGNVYGSLGDGTNINRLTPTLVIFP